MNNKNYVAFWIIAALIWFGWVEVMRVWGPKPPKDIAKRKIQKPFERGDQKIPGVQDAKSGSAETELTESKIEPEKVVPLRNNLILGFDIGMAKVSPSHIFARLSNRGAVVTYLQLNDFENEERDGPLVLLQEENPGVNSFELWLEKDPSLRNKNWEVVQSGPERIVFQTTALNGTVRVEKRFSLPKDSWLIKLELTFESLDQKPNEIVYHLTGGNGLPIESEMYTRFFRSEVAVLIQDGYPEFVERDSSSIAKANDEGLKKLIDSNKKKPVQFAGIACQYFASVVIQDAVAKDLLQKGTVGEVRPVFLGKDRKNLLWDVKAKPQLSNIGVQLTSVPLKMSPGQPLQHTYHLFNGPKEEKVLATHKPYALPELIHYYDFLYIPVGFIAKMMVQFLNFIYGFIGDYGIAIILLTVLVRGCMFPLTFKQTMSMQKMQALSPQLAEIKEKYGKDKEKLNRAMMDLYAKNKVNPLGGCLPMLLQLPIFIGLYQSLQNSFSLRQSSFLWDMTWIHDLAAPDKLFHWGPNIPFISHFFGEYFNLLPILAVVQMVVQMKIMSPPATTPEAQMQQKMMTFMPIVFGFIFYSFPSGLCVYFITSGLWSMAERKLIPKKNLPPKAPVAKTDKEATGSAGNGVPSWKTAVKTKKKGKARK